MIAKRYVERASSKQKPRAVARGFRSDASVRSTRSVVREDRSGEPVVQAGANDVFLEADIVHDRGDRGIEAAEIDVEIFKLGAPVAEEGVFDAGAGGPAELVVRRRSREASERHVDGGLDLAVGAAAGDVRQPAVEGVAEPAAECGEPGVR